MGFARVAGELGVDANGQAVADHQNRRIAQRQAVAEQLLERGIQVFAGRLVFPGEAPAPEHIGVAPRFAQHEAVLAQKCSRSGHLAGCCRAWARPARSHKSRKCGCAPWRSFRLSGAAWAPFGVEVCEIHEWVDISPQILSFQLPHAVIPAQAGIRERHYGFPPARE